MLHYKVFTIETPELRRVKVNFTLEGAAKFQRGSRGIALLFL